MGGTIQSYVWRECSKLIRYCTSLFSCPAESLAEQFVLTARNKRQTLSWLVLVKLMHGALLLPNVGLSLSCLGNASPIVKGSAEQRHIFLQSSNCAM